MARRVLIVGGGYAGAICANRLARKSRATEIVLANAQPWFVERIRLHQDAAGAGPRRTSLASVVRGTGVRLRVGTISEIDLAARRARVDGDDEPFDDLVLATGSVAPTRAVPGIERAWSCATEDRTVALRAHLATIPGGRVVIVGGGLTGIELATELAETRKELRITLVTSGDVAFMLGARARMHVRRALERARIELREETRVAAVDDGAVVLSTGDSLPSDATVWCGGFEATALARAAGLDVDDLGRAIVDPMLRSTSHDFVRVIGDAASVTGADGRILRMACATAVPQACFTADALARDIAGRDPPRAFSFAYAIQCLSLGRRDGIVHHVDPFDAPKRAWISGRTGALLKELVCRYPVTSIALERYGIGYHWPHARTLPASKRARAELIARSP